MTRCQQHPHTPEDGTEDAEWLSEQTVRSTWSTSAGSSASRPRQNAWATYPIRAWRDDLTRRPRRPRYARAILAADVAILTESGSSPPTGQQGIVDELPGVLVPPAPRPRPGRGPAGPGGGHRRGPFRTHRSPLGGPPGDGPGGPDLIGGPGPRPGTDRGAARAAHRAAGGRGGSPPADQVRHLPALPGRGGVRPRPAGLSPVPSPRRGGHDKGPLMSGRPPALS